MDEFKLECGQDPQSQGKQILKVSGGLTISDAGGLRQALLAALEAGSELQVDLTEMTGIDLTGLQLLCAAHQSALLGGKWFYITDGGNMTFREMATGAGFRRHTGCARDTSYSCIWAGGEN